MRETTEAANDVAMAPGMRQPGLSENLVQTHRQVLVGQFLRVRERKTEEEPHRRFHRIHMALLMRLQREAPRQRVGRVHVGGAAEGIARKLVGQQEQRQRAWRTYITTSGSELQARSQGVNHQDTKNTKFLFFGVLVVQYEPALRQHKPEFTTKHAPSCLRAGSEFTKGHQEHRGNFEIRNSNFLGVLVVNPWLAPRPPYFHLRDA